MNTHPFKPLLTKETKKLLVGTLPPENVSFYFSNSSNTRLWDLLKAIDDNSEVVSYGGNSLSNAEKEAILIRLRLGISDIIYKYLRDDYSSSKDKHIAPKEYNNLLKLAADNGVEELLFVYQSAFKWFIHSIDNITPVRLRKLKMKYTIGRQQEIEFVGKTIRCTLLPSPLNRGRKGETLKFKLDFYRKHIVDKGA